MNKHIPQLDTFRFFAVMLVIWAHWVPDNILNNIPLGFIGVSFFFVLSGFLISRNLLNTRHKLEINEFTRHKAIRNFFIRRILRIFPLYYLVLFVYLIVTPEIYNGHFWWYFFYSSNSLSYSLQAWTSSFSHFWSLAVEEQFYLVWPFLLLLYPYKGDIKKLLFAVILTSILFKCFYINEPGFVQILPFSCFDSFGIGALLGLIYSSDKYKRFQLSSKALLLVGVSSISLFMVTIYFPRLWIMEGFFISVFSAVLISKTLSCYTGFFGRILNLQIFKYLGKISYGLYVYHNFIPGLPQRFTGKFRNDLVLSVLENDSFMFSLQFILLVTVSALSFHFFENPINNFKKHFT